MGAGDGSGLLAQSRLSPDVTQAPQAAERIGRTTADLSAPRGPYAALDLGTNNCRLLVARPAADGFRVIDAFSRVVRLGEGLSQTGRLGEAAIERTLEALRVCRDKMAARGGDAGAADRHRGLPRRRERRRIPRAGARAGRAEARDRRSRDRGDAGRRRLQRTRRPRRGLDPAVRHRRRLVGNHLARPRARRRRAAAAAIMGVVAAGGRLAGGEIRRRRSDSRSRSPR